MSDPNVIKSDHECECSFEGKLPLSEVKAVIAMISEGNVGNGEILCHSACALGQLGMLIKQWQGPAIGAESVPEPMPVSLEGCVAAIEAEVANESTSNSFGANPLLSLLISKLVSLLLQQLDDYFDGAR